jgi:hypothetical protein
MPPSSHPPYGTRPARTSLRGRVRRARAVAETLLDARHPLVRQLHGTQVALEQMLTIAAADVVAGVLAYHGLPVGRPLAIAATLALMAAGPRLAVLRESGRALCLDMIIEGGCRLPIGAVERQWRQLEDPRHLADLARSLDEVVDIAARPLPALPSSRPLFTVHVVRRVGAQLSELAQLLRDDAPPARGVAMVERLITSGESPLYRADVELLSQEIRRARYLLTR